jgi:hypothetical protein
MTIGPLPDCSSRNENSMRKNNLGDREKDIEDDRAGKEWIRIRLNCGWFGIICVLQDLCIAKSVCCKIAVLQNRWRQ